MHEQIDFSKAVLLQPRKDSWEKVVARIQEKKEPQHPEHKIIDFVHNKIPYHRKGIGIAYRICRYDIHYICCKSA